MFSSSQRLSPAREDEGQREAVTEIRTEEKQPVSWGRDTGSENTAGLLIPGRESR